MSQEELKIDICTQALVVLKQHRAAIQPDMFESIEQQLEWLISYFEGASKEREKLFTLTFGHYAAREIDARERKLVDALNRAFYVAVRTRQGLKLEPKFLGMD